ncbi:MAG: LuxR C-terminal-related transcriptional regulator [Solirubrobacteraceae bacterium]
MDVLACVERASMLKRACGHQHPHVAVLSANGAGALADELRAMKASLPRSRSVIVLRDGDSVRVRTTVGRALDGAVFERELALALPIAVSAAALGQSSVPRGFRFDPVEQQLSDREREVVELAIAGRSNAAIAARLCLSGSTVKTHLASVFSKLGVHSRDEAAAVLSEQRHGQRQEHRSDGPPALGHIANGVIA